MRHNCIFLIENGTILLNPETLRNRFIVTGSFVNKSSLDFFSPFSSTSYSKAPVAMATSGYSEDLQPQQANTVTIATPAVTTPSSAKAAHFLSEISSTSGPIASASSQSAAASKTGQDALCSQAPPTQAQSQKAVVLTTPTQHYVTPEIQHAGVQKTNGQGNSPQYIIVTVTGELLLRERTHAVCALITLCKPCSGSTV